MGIQSLESCIMNIEFYDTLYIARYEDSMYPEDNYMIGAYKTELQAENACINECISNCSDPSYKDPQNHHRFYDNYNVREVIFREKEEE